MDGKDNTISCCYFAEQHDDEREMLIYHSVKWSIVRDYNKCDKEN